MLTETKVLSYIISKHPEIFGVTVANYPALIPHGAPDSSKRETREVYSVRDLLRRGDWPTELLHTKEISAIGSLVDVCDNSQCPHRLSDHDFWILERWQEGAYPEIKHPKSIVFLDVEYPDPAWAREIMDCLKVVDEDVYIFSSGGGYHIVVDKLVDLSGLPYEYGKILYLMGNKQGSQSLMGWGMDLIQNGHDRRKVQTWCDTALEKIGHVDEPESGKEIHVIDLRHIAHSLIRLEKTVSEMERLSERRSDQRYLVPAVEFGAGYLRISDSPGKYDTPPQLIALKTSGAIHYFPTENRQPPRLLTLEAASSISRPIVVSKLDPELLNLSYFNPIFTLHETKYLNELEPRLFLRSKIFKLMVTMDAAACNGSTTAEYIYREKLPLLNPCLKAASVDGVPESLDPLYAIWSARVKSFQALVVLSRPDLEQEGELTYTKTETDVRLPAVIDKSVPAIVYGSAVSSASPHDIDLLLVVDDYSFAVYKQLINWAISQIEDPKISFQIVPRWALAVFLSSDPNTKIIPGQSIMISGPDTFSIPAVSQSHKAKIAACSVGHQLIRAREALTVSNFPFYDANPAKAKNLLKQVRFVRDDLMTAFRIPLPEAVPYRSPGLRDQIIQLNLQLNSFIESLMDCNK
ncbi:MAG: hypothetical protein UU42_C0021G0009 [Candidatus Woesebacteria bacterium GW2011_GWA1_41_13b]|uniref:Uncharacterized protein n=1 Tax=Candidatus Woesebacteria bacterium GW2011_GWA1_41_13b TaxID=1618555 RepID=A0A0G0XTD1_9BACT|nr:MAG: hypothetical protein UU42_C0021G0009 [Candidatus Woesebacteria bacterium GW2011_GWA1_41_13b]